MKRKHTLLIGISVALLLTACQQTDDSAIADDNTNPVIQVGGLDTDELTVQSITTRAAAIDDDTVTKIDAERISWLVKPLKSGLDIHYGIGSNSCVATLKLLSEANDDIKYSSGNLAEYSFLRKDNDLVARWFDNGAHSFSGVYVPDRLVTGAVPTSLTTDQHFDKGGTDETQWGNYTLLDHYLAMPPNHTIHATVGRIKLPFRHRLARVLAYILIDPIIGSDVKIEGYALETDGKDDPTTSKIRFCNVNVLSGVTDNTPHWTKVRKAVPHFMGERGSYDDSQKKSLADEFIGYYDTQKKKYIYPTDKEWADIHALTFDATTNLTADGAYERTVYGKVPVYDLIVRPTYTSLDNVMYDEEGFANAQTKQNLYVATNQIDFDITLDNGLNYTKKFTFDLDANHETVVYLRISRERVDYNNSGSELWIETVGSDNYYGVNNQNGNTLSIAGSSWQRAYTNSTTNHTVTDGHQYLQDEEDDAQYVSDSKWIELLLHAYEGGEHHGDYFILDHDITIPSSILPDNFEFTGHLDAMDHTITITSTEGGRTWLFDGLNGTYLTPQEKDANAIWQANVHSEGGQWVPTLGWRAELLNIKLSGGSFFKSGAIVSGYVNNCWEGETPVSNMPSLPEYE